MEYLFEDLCSMDMISISTDMMSKQNMCSLITLSLNLIALDIQGISIRPFPGCENAAGKLSMSQRW